MTAENLIEIYKLLYERFGPQHWWPGETELETIVGAILTQNTNWQNVEKALANLKNENLLNADKLHEIDTSYLAEFIRPSGYYNIKAKRLKNFFAWLFDNYGGRLDKIKNVPTETLREQLLSIKGVGRETADSILLYAIDRPVFVVDTYTFRVMVRHGLIDPEADYEQMRRLFEDNLQQDIKMFNEYHALLVRVGKEYCRPKARCESCPLKSLPHDIEETF